ATVARAYPRACSCRGQCGAAGGLRGNSCARERAAARHAAASTNALSVTTGIFPHLGAPKYIVNTTGIFPPLGVPSCIGNTPGIFPPLGAKTPSIPRRTASPHYQSHRKLHVSLLRDAEKSGRAGEALLCATELRKNHCAGATGLYGHRHAEKSSAGGTRFVSGLARQRPNSSAAEVGQSAQGEAGRAPDKLEIGEHPRCAECGEHWHGSAESGGDDQGNTQGESGATHR
ncbi:MAG: hypothetical protein JWN41_820, partial [Thermoleophilia bacterium]|nr:hypothetical protein [Thermoleophilia bacterium]